MNRIVIGLVVMQFAASVWAQSLRPGMGAVRYADGAGTGVTFRTWAPQAASVSVAGEFNAWSTAAHPLTRESVASGLWSVDVPGATAGQAYKYVINGNLWRRDPCARLLEPTGSRNSLVFDGTNYPWAGDLARSAELNDLVIYEAHVGTLFDPAPADGQVGGFLDATQRIAHLAGLGINAVEFMPVNEFNTDRSWGYNVYYPFAIETTYGAPDDLKTLVRACHDAGMSVFMDVVHNHWGDTPHLTGQNPDDWSLWRYDGWFSGTNAGVMFFTNSPFFASPWGPRPNYAEAAIRTLIRDTFRMWKDEYHLDGFRWDTPKHIIYTDWDPTFHDRLKTVMEQGDDNARDMALLASAISGLPRRVIYTESHDTAGDLNGGQRFPMYMPWAAENGYYSRKRSMLAAALAFTAPGIPMILQGQEMMETNQFSDARALDWSRTNAYGSAVEFYRDLVGLRRNLGGRTRGLQAETVEFLRVDQAAKVIVYRRGTEVPSPDDVVVVANLRNTALENYAIPLPAELRARVPLPGLGGHGQHAFQQRRHAAHQRGRSAVRQRRAVPPAGPDRDDIQRQGDQRPLAALDYRLVRDQQRHAGLLGPQVELLRSRHHRLRLPAQQPRARAGKPVVVRCRAHHQQFRVARRRSGRRLGPPPVGGRTCGGTGDASGFQHRRLRLPACARLHRNRHVLVPGR